jgi:cysteine-rich repeat protein
MRDKSAWLTTTALACGLAISFPFAACSSSSGTHGKDAGTDATASAVCGNGMVETGEACDLGMDNGTAGAACKSDCTWACIPGTRNGNAICNSDHNPCTGTNGTAICTTMHTCQSGPALREGDPCGSGFVCHGNVCSASTCGDGIMTPAKECDLGVNNGTGKGCDSNCKWDCLSTDPTRNCASTNACYSQGTCDDATHVCVPGMPRPDGTLCGTAEVCKAGNCVSPNCGDGVIEPPEQCDFGTGNGLGTGCEGNCTLSCVLSPDPCLTPDVCAWTNACTAIMRSGAAGQRCVVGTPPADGAACSVGGSCKNHLCVTPNCGNGTKDPGEECDWGTANMHGAGCEPDCTFSCSPSAYSPNVCPGADVCSASPQVCTPIAGPAGTNDGKKCSPGTVLAQCAPCGTGTSLCAANVCKVNTCGDGCVAGSEQCDPPNGTTCDATCRNVVCGDGVRSGQEQCDDGNTTNLDGCDSTCMFEQIHRTTGLLFSGAKDALCPVNTLGSVALTRSVLAKLQGQVQGDVAGSLTNMLFKYMRSGSQPIDLSGTSGPVVLGSLSGAVQYGDAGAYSGTADVDWWYTVDSDMIDGTTRNPLTSIAGTFANKTLTAGPGRLTVKMNLSGNLRKLDLWNVKIQVAIGASSAPKMSTGLPPGHLASEQLLPSLTSFETAGVGPTGPAGEMCANTTTASFSLVNVPPDIVTGGPVACDEVYVSSNSFLDVLVNGCHYQGATVVNATQPEMQDPTVTFPSGTRAPYKLSSSSSSHVIDTCVDSSPSPSAVPVATCLAGLAYSNLFRFQSDRVIAK